MDSQYADLLETLILSDTAHVYGYPDDVPWLLSILDGCIVFGTFDGDGRPAAVIETDHPEIIEWAESRYRKYLQQADRVTRNQVDPVE